MRENFKEIIVTPDHQIPLEVPDTPNDSKEDGRTVKALITKLHEHYLRDNMYDEGDLIELIID